MSDPALYAFTGGRAPTLDELRRRYERQTAGHSPDGTQRWLNWIVRLTESGEVVGTVQATVRAREELFVADLAWVVALAHQRRGYATEAAATMAAWLRERGADALAANIHPEHHASTGVARALGLAPTGEVVDGEVRWVGPGLGGPR